MLSFDKLSPNLQRRVRSGDHMTVKLIFALIIALTFCAAVGEEETVGKFDIESLAGNWEGKGKVRVPVTGMKISINGKAAFAYDSLTRKLRTSLEGKRFFFSYTDSGYLTHDTLTDSITWEIWDSFGKYSFYTGKVENNIINGVKTKEGRLYNVIVDFITNDSLTFKLTTTDEDGDVTKRVALDMWRKE
jgi:hypothetical protein